MKKFNIRKVLDGLTAASSSSSATAQPGTPRENDAVHETLQSEHFQLCKVRSPVSKRAAIDGTVMCQMTAA